MCDSALLGIGGTLLGVVAGFGLTYFSDISKSKKRRKNLMGALLVEVGNLHDTAREIFDDVVTKKQLCMKRFDYDILSASRMTLAEYEEVDFLALIAKAHTNVKLTNDWQNKHAAAREKDIEGRPRGAVPTEPDIRPYAESAIINTVISIKELKEQVEEIYPTL